VISALLLLVTLDVHAQASAQASIQGRVTSDRAPVSGANVRVQDTKYGAAATANGFYRITGLPTGPHVLVVSAVGFKTTRRHVDLSAGTTTVDITLEDAVLANEELVVTGTMREQYVKDSPVKVSVVNAERLQRGKASSNLMDLIGSVNGLTTQLNCGICGTNAIRINGVEGPNTAVLIDGMPIMGALASVYGLNGISPSIIDQVEVIKGPQSTLYGTQALGGVVNIITKDPENTPTFSGEVYGRSTREGSIDLAVSPHVGRFKGFVSANALRMENYFDDNGDGFADVPMRSQIALFGKGSLAGPSGAPVLNVAAKLYGENRTGGTANFTDALRGSNTVYGESIYTRRGEFLANYRPARLDGLRFEGAFTYHDQDSYYGTEHYVAQQQIAFGQATYSAPVTDALQLLIGGTLRYETYNDNTPATSRGADKRLIPGAFGQGKWSLGDVTLLGGLRVDHQAEHGFIMAPRLSAKYSPSDRMTLRASGGTGFRVVNVFTEDHAALTGSREVVFAEDLDPERSRSVTASVEHILSFGTNPLTVSVDGFYTRFSNKIIPDYDQDPNLIVYENLDGFSVTRGFAVSLDQNFTVLPLTYDLGFTLTDVFTEEGGEREAMTYAPDYTGTIGATYQVRALGLEVDYTANLVGPKRMPDFYVEAFGRNQESPTYTTHDVKLVKAFGDVNSARGVGVDVYLAAENLFDRTQGSPLVDADTPFSSTFDTIYTWGPIVGRTFSLGVRMDLR
jgi:outer membrane receptor for ferrienterochelin and colicins